MTGECSEFLKVLDEGGHGVPGVIDHLERCPRCRRHEALLAVLASLEPSPADEARVREIMRALPHPRWQLRRVTTWVPAAVGAMVAALGLWLLGGVPAAGSAPSANVAARGLLSWVVSWVVDAVTAVGSASSAALAVVSAGGVGLLLALAAVGLAGGWLVLALARRRSGERG